MAVELPDIVHPPSFSAPDVIGSCPFVLLWTRDRAIAGWLVLVDDDNVEIINELPLERFRSTGRHRLRRDTVTQVRILSDQPSIREPGGPARGSAVL